MKRFFIKKNLSRHLSGFALFELLVVLVCIGVAAMYIIPAMSPITTQSNIDNVMGEKPQPVKNLNPNNPYGLNFQIIAKTDEVNFDDAKRFCQSNGGNLPSREQLEEIMSIIYRSPEGNCRLEETDGIPHYKLCIPYVISNHPLKQYFGNRDEIMIWSDTAYNTENTYAGYLSSANAFLTQIANTNDITAICVK